MMGASEYLSVNKLQKQRKNCLDWGALSLQRLPKWTAWSAHCFPVEVTRYNHMSMFMHHNKDCNCVIVHSRKSASPQGLAYHKWTSPKISHTQCQTASTWRGPLNLYAHHYHRVPVWQRSPVTWENVSAFFGRMWHHP